MSGVRGSPWLPHGLLAIFGDLDMKPVKRHGVNKQNSAKKFVHDSKHTKGVNLPRQVMRGGWRM